jgi:uncharacterized membrane protein YhaH (DUF805 family)
MNPFRRLRDRFRPNWPLIVLCAAVASWVAFLVLFILWEVLP